MAELTDMKVRRFSLPPDKKQTKLYDGNGLYLLVNKSGKYWRYDCKVNGKRKTVALGVYPAVSLKDARQKMMEVKTALARGDVSSVLPSRRKTPVAGSTFGEVAEEWLERHSRTVSEGHVRTIRHRLETYVLPFLGDMPVDQIESLELLHVLERIQAAGKIETAHRVKFICGQIFRYAVLTGRCKNDPVASLRNALLKRQPKRMPTILEPERIGELLRAIDGYEGEFHVTAALKMAIYTFVRSSELRLARWSEFDMDERLWCIPAERMKMKTRHLVPLSNQVVEILEQLRPLTGHGELLFPSLRSKERPISDNTLNAALRRLGFSKDEIVVHGFRSMASTLLNEQGWPPDAIERQLAHIERNAVRRAYDHSQHLDTRKKMMQAWADHLDKLRSRRG